MACLAINYSVRNDSRGRRKMKQLVLARSRHNLMDHSIFLSPRLGRAGPPPLRALTHRLVSLVERLALNMRGATIAPGSVWRTFVCSYDAFPVRGGLLGRATSHSPR